MDDFRMKNTGGIGKNLKIGERMTNMLIDSITAKLTILDQVTLAVEEKVKKTL